MEGIIKVLKGGFGFISSEGQQGDVFFHASNLINVEFDSLQEGQAVTFEMGEGNNGKQQATHVELA